ncbi:MAG: UDP-N-acetylglucosamine 2-epimerase (non-hydrolyzing) [Anaerolineales bacterium]
MKVLTVLGTRPEIIRLSRVIEKLDRLCEHKLVHTGQNFDPNLSDIFFQQLRVRRPDYYLGIMGETFGQQIGKMLAAMDKVLGDERPDALLILGDTNSGLCSFIAKRMGIPVFHMEAGNRCYDDRVPEEVNRRVIDHSSTTLMPYTQRSKENLVREGIENQRIYVIGNPIKEVLDHYSKEIEGSDILSLLQIEPQKYFLVTMHRSENVDIESRLRSMASALDQLQKLYGYPVICSTHPRTRQKLQKFEIGIDNEQVRFLTPIGLFDFVALEKNAFCILSDSGTVQEESCIFGVPNVTLRDVTERPETIECGSNMLSGIEPETILRCVHFVLNQKGKWTPPIEYLAENVSDTVIKILGGFSWKP